MSIQLDFVQLFSEIHGIDLPEFEFEEVPNVFSRKQNGDYGSPYYKNDDTGREYFMPVTVTYAGGAEALPDGATTSGVNVIWDLPHPVVSTSMSKTIVKTPMTEREGVVIQRSSINAYEINIKGLLIGKAHQYPEELEKMLRDVFVTGASMKMRSVKTDIWLNEIGYGVVVENMTIPPHGGVQHVVGYDIRFTSDSIFDLEEIGI